MTEAEPRTVYAVTEGEYSDFRYKAIFEDRADADQAQANGLGDGVHEIRYYPKGAPLPTKVLFWKAVATVDRDGTFPDGASEPRLWPGPIVEWTCDELPDLRRPVVDQTMSYTCAVRIEARAVSGELALRTCSDRAAKLRAEILEADGHYYDGLDEALQHLARGHHG